MDDVILTLTGIPDPFGVGELGFHVSDSILLENVPDAIVPAHDADVVILPEAPGAVPAKKSRPPVIKTRIRFPPNSAAPAIDNERRLPRAAFLDEIPCLHEVDLDAVHFFMSLQKLTDLPTHALPVFRRTHRHQTKSNDILIQGLLEADLDLKLGKLVENFGEIPQRVIVVADLERISITSTQLDGDGLLVLGNQTSDIAGPISDDGKAPSNDIRGDDRPVTLRVGVGNFDVQDVTWEAVDGHFADIRVPCDHPQLGRAVQAAKPANPHCLLDQTAFADLKKLSAKNDGVEIPKEIFLL